MPIADIAPNAPLLRAIWGKCTLMRETLTSTSEKLSFGSVIDADIVPDTERQTTVAVENPAHFSQLADITPDGWDRASPLAQPEMFWPCRLDRNSTAQAIVP